MAYTKPSIVKVSNAVEAILGSANKCPLCIQLDNDGVHYNASVTAYEADE